MKISRYKLIKTYPNSPLLGTYISSTQSEYFHIKPNNYPEFWEKVDFTKTFLDSDLEKIYEGDVCYFINNEMKIDSFQFIPYQKRNFDKFYVKKFTCEQKLNNKVLLQIENELIENENITLYGVLAKSDWSMVETTALDVYRSKLRGNNNTSWKYFRTKRERVDYIFKHRPFISINDLEEYNFSSTIYGLSFNSFRDLFNKKYGKDI